MGASDTISINLTDTDDLDGVYKIDQEGMIDLPFIGKIKLDEQEAFIKDEIKKINIEVARPCLITLPYRK